MGSWWRALTSCAGAFFGTLGFVLYVLALWSYTYAVFTKPGSPLGNVREAHSTDTPVLIPSQKHGYSHLPTTEASLGTSITTKENGGDRYCKKCQCKKPDRTHHCSSCNSCVLKMDHHCPWLANCLGLYNYKAFVLFLIYTSLLCILSFGVSFHIVYTEVFADSETDRENAPEDAPRKYPTGEFGSDLTPVNWILLIVVSGVIGLVLTGFTIWHIILCTRNMTTIESMEKVRYTAPSLRTGIPPPGAQLVNNNRSEANRERQHEFDRYNNYLLEESSKKLPHAFNLGRSRNIAQVFGGRDKWHLWLFPMFTGTGDGWNWETSQVWKDAVEVLQVERDQRLQDQTARERAAGWGYDASEERNWNNNPNPQGLIKHAGGQRSLNKADIMLGKAPKYRDIDSVPMRNLKPNRPMGLYDDISSDEDYDEGSDFEQTDFAKPDAPKAKSGNAADWSAWD